MIADSSMILAKDLKIGMTLGKEIITNLTMLELPNKITLLTQDGTIIANGIWTTTICHEYL
jgi:hypothetical protein